MSSVSAFSFFILQSLYRLSLTFRFSRKNILYILGKIILLLIFLIPTLAITLVAIVIALINILLSKILLVGLVWGLITGLISYVSALFFSLCNILDIRDYTEATKKLSP